MQSEGLRVKLNSTLTRWNEGEVEDMFAIADRFGVLLQFDPHVTQKDDGDKEPLSILASEQGINRLLEVSRARTERARAQTVDSRDTGVPVETGSRKKHCGSGSSSLTLDPYGDLYPCVQWRQSVGNLHRERVKDIWLNSHALTGIRQGNEKVKEYVDTLGPEGDAIGFCPAIAWQETGSPTRLYQSARMMLEARNRTVRTRVAVAAPETGPAI